MRTMITVDKKSKAWLKRRAYELEVPLGEMYQIVFNFYLRLRTGNLRPEEIKEVEEYWDQDTKPISDNEDKILMQSTIALDAGIRDQLDEFAGEDEAGTLSEMYCIILSFYVRMVCGQLTEDERKRVEEWWYKSTEK